MSPIVSIQRRMMLLGRIRLGDKGGKGQPQKLTTFRLTSASKLLLEHAAAEYGGEVRAWEGAPDEGMFELYTTSDQLDVILPPVFSDTDGEPTVPVSQFYEAWSGGGCVRRCDGVTEMLTGGACLCNPDKRECKVTTRVNVMLPKIPGLGVWRLDSHGMNAAMELPGTLDVLMMAASQHRFIPAVLRLEQRSKKVPGEGTRRFVVPVIDLPGVKVQDMLEASGGMVAINPPPAPLPRSARPELPAAPPPPVEPAFDRPEDPGFGVQPSLPVLEEPAAAVSQNANPVGDPFGEEASLIQELVRLGEALGAREATESAIERKLEENGEDWEKTVRWLKGQVVNAQKKLDAKGA